MSVITPKQILGGKFAYKEKLRSSEWVSFRGSVRESKNACCQMCKRGGDVVLQVHHWFYDPDREPWEYGLDEVALLCAGCHEQMHEHLETFRKDIFSRLKPDSLRVLNLALASGLEKHNPLTLSYAIAEMCSSPGSVERFCAAWHRDASKRTAANSTPQQ